MMSPTLTDRFIQTGDGRRVAFVDVGDPTAPAVVFCPGFMACRLTAQGAPGVRVVAIDRPGVGGSTAQPARTVLDWPADVAAVTEHLGIRRFAVLGHSGGSPYAAACAVRLADRVTALGIACGFAPFERADATNGMTKRMASAVPILRRAPWLAQIMTRPLPRQYRRDPAAAFERQFGRDLPDADRRALADPAAKQLLLDAAIESTRQGPRGLAVELQLLFSRPWGFALDEIAVPTYLWYGSDDTLAPPSAGRYLAAQIPGARIVEYPDTGHMAVFTHWDEILATLRGARA
jgi:pimeloyl-ACP methyl ester carboxylesterase